jgi:hypothetical protein
LVHEIANTRFHYSCNSRMAAAADSRPNVVVFLADDAEGDYSQNGNTQVATTNIDSLAARRDARPLFRLPGPLADAGEFLTGGIIRAAACAASRRDRSG